MSNNIIGFPSRSDRRVPPRYRVASRAGTVRGINMEVWRTVEGNRLDVRLSPTAGGYTRVAHASVETFDLAVMLSQTIFDALIAADAMEPRL